MVLSREGVPLRAITEATLACKNVNFEHVVKDPTLVIFYQSRWVLKMVHDNLTNRNQVTPRIGLLLGSP